MTKKFEPIELSVAQCEQDLIAYRELLDSSPELSEKHQIAPFFRDHPQLAALIGSIHLPHNLDRVCRELDLFGNFNCDLAVGDSKRRTFVLIEYEDARRDSIFHSGEKYHNDWGQRFEHGFSQLVDWFWLLDLYRDNVDFRKRFGEGHINFFGLLVIGRDHFMTPEQQTRFAWRLDRVSVNTNNITCITFDGLHDFFKDRLASIRTLAAPHD